MANEAENEGSFPGAYSGQGRSWERKTREAIGLLPEKYGFQPKVVLSTRAPATITATAVEVPMCERQQFGSSYIGVKDSSGLITPRKLAASLATPALGLHSTPPFTPATSSTSGATLAGFASASGSGGSGSGAAAPEPNLMPNSGEHEVCNPEFVPDDKWKKLREYVYSWVLAKVGQEHRYLIQGSTQVGDVEQLFKDLRGAAESNPAQFVETMAKEIEKLQLIEVTPHAYAHQLQVFCAKQYGYYENIVESSAAGITENKFVRILVRKVGLTMPSLSNEASRSQDTGNEWDLAAFKSYVRRKVANGRAVIEPGGFENLRRIQEARQKAEERQLQQHAQRSNGGYSGGYGGDTGVGMGTRTGTDSHTIANAEIDHILSQRELARRNRDYTIADQMRDYLNSRGVRVYDRRNEWEADDGRTGPIVDGRGGVGHGNGYGATGYRDGPGPNYQSPSKRRRKQPWSQRREQHPFAVAGAMVNADPDGGGGGIGDRGSGGDVADDNGDAWVEAQVAAYERQLGGVEGMPEYNRISFNYGD